MSELVAVSRNLPGVGCGQLSLSACLTVSLLLKYLSDARVRSIQSRNWRWRCSGPIPFLAKFIRARVLDNDVAASKATDSEKAKEQFAKPSPDSSR